MAFVSVEQTSAPFCLPCLGKTFEFLMETSSVVMASDILLGNHAGDLLCDTYSLDKGIIPSILESLGIHFIVPFLRLCRTDTVREENISENERYP